MGERNHEAENEFFTTEELREALRWYVELPDDVPVDMDVVLHIMEVVDKREQEEHPELRPDTEKALERFRARRAQLEAEENGETFGINPNQPPHVAAPSKPRRSAHRFFHAAVKAVGAVAAMVMLFFGCIGIANAAGYDAWERVASLTEELFTFRERGGRLEVNSPTSHEPDGSGSYTSLQDALDAYGITTQVAPKWIPYGYNAESVTAITTAYGANISAVYMSQEKLSDADVLKGIEVTVIFDISGAMDSQSEKDKADPEVYRSNGIEHYIMTNTGDSVAVWQQGSCKCFVSSNSISLKDLKTMIDSIYWRS